ASCSKITHLDSFGAMTAAPYGLRLTIVSGGATILNQTFSVKQQGAESGCTSILPTTAATGALQKDVPATMTLTYETKGKYYDSFNQKTYESPDNLNFWGVQDENPRWSRASVS